MNKLLMIGILGYILCFGNKNESMAQTGQHVNISSQPIWGPEGYDRVDYYYLPNIETYYCVATHQFIYLSGGRWVFTNNLPPKYARYDLYSGYKVIINKPRPYLNFNEDRTIYLSYRDYRGRQVPIRDSHNPKYIRSTKH
ncbi:hypothetical protein BEL04_04610 [Mucilaginibacter sp. PPCGB 2223]|uniref:hypothetical protein n=1 Tax=Mucilaginibacter sp. PPCGB 2223 TaxID=1886027 RepID=UPI00082516E9|nr:hypothetical protein [Mucilaginibacter sp. PPCGB 2223]OCX53580.1 hypothetical protein BEL04_04610 [Mucilaginibacter sp. PPCGB 2223]